MRSIIYIVLATAAALSLALCCDGVSDRATYTPPAPQQDIVACDTVRLIFGGDLMQHLPQVEAALRADGVYDYSRSFEYVAPLFRDADFAVVNLETTLTTSGRYSGYPCFASPPALADHMADMGIDLALLANNHCCDRMSRGIDTTIEQLDRCNIRHTGVYRDSLDYLTNNVQYFDCRGIRFALLNYTYGTNGIPVPRGRYVNIIDTLSIKRDIATINRDSIDCIIACMHWGYEYMSQPNREQRSLRAMLAREGVDIVIGGHPHVVQPYEQDSLGIVYYSLGNLVSNQQRRYCDGGIIADIEVVRCDTLPHLTYRASAHPVWVLCPDYRILPQSVADTLQMSDEARQRYNQFISDTERVLRR